MKLWFNICLLLLVGGFGSLRAQSDSVSVHKYLDTPVSHRLILSWAPLSLLDPYDGSSIRRDIKVKVNHHIYVYCEAGLYVRMPWDYDDKLHGYMLKPGIQWNFRPVRDGKTWSTTYLAVEAMYKFKRYQFTDSIDLYTQPMYLTEVPMTRHVYAANFVIGQEMKEHWGLRWEWFGGLGVRYTDSKTTLSPLQYQHIVYSNDYPNTDNYSIGRIGQYYFLNVTLGIRIDLGLF